jgi:deoxyribodipyrimidine photolyase
MDQERELFKVEHAKLEDDVSSVSNSLSKLGDEILVIRQDTTTLSRTLCEDLAELKNILSIMRETKIFASQRRKARQRSQNSDLASASSNEDKMLDSDTCGTDKYKVITPDMVQKTE